MTPFAFLLQTQGFTLDWTFSPDTHNLMRKCSCVWLGPNWKKHQLLPNIRVLLKVIWQRRSVTMLSCCRPVLDGLLRNFVGNSAAEQQVQKQPSEVTVNTHTGASVRAAGWSGRFDMVPAASPPFHRPLCSRLFLFLYHHFLCSPWLSFDCCFAPPFLSGSLSFRLRLRTMKQETWCVSVWLPLRVPLYLQFREFEHPCAAFPVLYMCGESNTMRSSFHDDQCPT